MHGHDLSGQPRSLRQVRGGYLQHQPALLPQLGQVLPGGLGILLSVSAGVAMRKAITIATAATSALFALGCGGSLARDDAGGTGLGGASGTAGGRGDAGGGAGAGQATDGGSDQSSCTALCGRVERGLRATGNCMYVVSCPAVGDFTGLAVLVNGQAVPRDASHVEGWDYTDASMSAFELFGQVCMDVLNNGASVDVSYLCEVA